MRTLPVLVLVLFSHVITYSQQDVLGEWKSIDDESGEATSIVNLYKKNDQVYGKIVKILKEDADPNAVCDKCPKNDERYGQPVVGLEIIRGLSWTDDAYEGGTILKPDEGKVYECKLWLEDGKLKVRGSWGLFFRTQTWIKTD